MERKPESSAETWSPVFAPGEKPDMQRMWKIRDEVKTLMDQTRYEEALQRQIWYFNHSLQYGESDPVRLSSGTANWVELGRRYPKAKQALIETRDRDTREFSEGRGYAGLFSGSFSSNQGLQDDDATVALFKSIHQRDQQLAGQCYFYAEDVLMKKGEYELCLSCIGNPQTRFEFFRNNFDSSLGFQRRMREAQSNRPASAPHPPGGSGAPPDMEQIATDNFVGQVCRLVEILVATGHGADAEKIRDQAVRGWTTRG